jgi:hypothetical protein
MKVKGICDVHRYALRDTLIRDVQYCSVCDAWICDQCGPDTALRAKAMANKALIKLRIRKA